MTASPSPADAPAPTRPILVASTDTGLKRRVDTALGWAVALLMGLSVVNVLWQVFTRFVLGDPSAFTDELARYLLIWVGLLGAAYAAGQRLHLAVDLLPQRLTGDKKHVLEIVIEACVFVFAMGVMVWGGWVLVRLQWELGQTSAVLQVPLAVVYSVLPLSGLLIAYYAAAAVADHVRVLRHEPPRQRTTEEPHARAYAERLRVDRTDAPTGEQSRPSHPSEDL